MRISSFALAAALAASMVAPTLQAQARRPMTFEDMMAMKRLGETAVSPDGRWLAYSVTSVNLDQNKKTTEWWLQKIEGGEPAKIAVMQPGDSGFEFAADGRSVLFLSGRDGSQQVWLAGFDTASGATTNAKRLTAIATEADGAIWAPDGKSIVFVSQVYPDCPAIGPADNGAGDKCNAERDRAAAESKVKARIFTHLMYRHWDHWNDEKRPHLFQVLVEGGAIRDLTPGETHEVPPEYPTDPVGCGCAISPDSKELAFMMNPDPVSAVSTSTQIYTLDLTSPAAKPVKVSTSKGGNLNPAYSPDGKWLAWRSQERAGYESDRFRLVVYDRAAKTISDVLKNANLPIRDPKKLSRWAPANFDLWVNEFVWDEDSKQIYFVAESKGESPIYSVIVPAGQLDTYGKIRGYWSEIHGIRINKRFYFIGNLMRINSPSEVAIGNPLEINDTSRTANVTFGENPSVQEITQSTYEPKNITHLNDAVLAQLDLAKLDDFWFTAKDGTKLQGFLVKPPAFDATKKYPVKFLIHGGPQGAWGDDWSYRWNPELFAANGYVVVMINPRGSTGYGQKVVDGVNGDWGGKPFSDLMEGLDYAEQHYSFIDKSRECALGASYGGYMANWVLGHTDRFRCIVTHDGMFDAESAFGTTEEDWFNIWEFKGHPWDYYGKPDSENPFRKWSPSLYARNFKTPTLVVHGQLDYRLDVSEGFQLFDTLQMLGVPSKMLYFPDEGHWVLKPQNSRLWWKTVTGWVDEWTKSRE